MRMHEKWSASTAPNTKYPQAIGAGITLCLLIWTGSATRLIPPFNESHYWWECCIMLLRHTYSDLNRFQLFTATSAVEVSVNETLIHGRETDHTFECYKIHSCRFYRGGIDRRLGLAGSHGQTRSVLTRENEHCLDQLNLKNKRLWLHATCGAQRSRLVVRRQIVQVWLYS